MGTTGQPAVVYLPAGTYLMESSIQLYVGTVVVGDPINPPVLKASANFPHDHIVYGKDPNHGGTINFYIAFKNIIIDSTAIDPSTSITLLDWTVSQATQLTNVVFRMPNYSTGHTGLSTQYDYNSNVILVGCISSSVYPIEPYAETVAKERSHLLRRCRRHEAERPTVGLQRPDLHRDHDRCRCRRNRYRIRGLPLRKCRHWYRCQRDFRFIDGDRFQRHQHRHPGQLLQFRKCGQLDHP